MKKAIALFLSIVFTGTAIAQLDRSKMPEAGPAPELEFGEYKLYELDNGLKLIVVEDHKLPRITMSLIVDRDQIVEGEKAGYVELAGEMMRQGTTNRAKDVLDEEVDFIGADLSTSSTSVFVRGLSKYSEKLIELMADVTLNPAFPADEFEKLQKQMISGLESSKDNPNAVAGRVFRKVLYGENHPYGESASIESVKKVTLEDCKKYYNEYWLPNISYLAIVGDIKPKDAKKLVEKHFSNWKRGEAPNNEFEDPAPNDGVTVSLVNKDNSVQSVLMLGNTIELKPGSPDEIKLRMANQILGVGSMGRLFRNIREDKAYTYGAYSDFDSDRLTGSFNASASVRNEVTDSAITEFLNEFERLRTEPVSEDELNGARNAIIGSIGRSLENPQTLASYALNIQRYNLPEDYYENYLEKLDEINTTTVMEVAKKYIRPDKMDITVVGKASDISEKLEKFGTIEYYDVEGNPTEKPTGDEPAPEGMTAQDVIDNYIKAIGGKTNLEKIKDMKTTMGVQVTGVPVALKGEELKKRPNMYSSRIYADAMPGDIEAKIYNGKRGKVSGMQGSRELEGQDLEDLKIEAKMVPELHYGDMGYKLNLAGISDIDGEKAYKVEVTSPSGETTTDYFSVESGLKVRSTSTLESPQGPVNTVTNFSDYREVNGVKFPYSQNAEMGPQKINVTVEEISINSGIEDSKFAIE